jgi:hypothetical protein
VIEIAAYVSTCKTAKEPATQAATAQRKGKHTDAEKELLASCAKSGTCFLVSIDDVPGTWVRAGGRDFIDRHDPRVAERYRNAFQSLCERGYISHEGGSLFTLTSRGLEEANAAGAKP